MTDRVRSAIVGTGFMGQVHARAVRACGGDLVAVVGRTREKGAAAAEAFGARRAATVGEVVGADDVDLVHICTPNDLHAEVARLVISAGKHVICEKPLATDTATTAELVELARQSGVVAAVPFAYRFYPSVRDARARLKRGDAGRIRLVHGGYLQDWLSRPADDNWRVDPLAGGPSRAFADIGVHWCDLLEFTTGHRIVSVNAVLLPGERPTEDGCTVMLQTHRGAIGSVVVSQVSPGRKNRLWLSVDGEDLSIEFDQERPDSLWIGGRDATQVVARGTEPGPYDIVPAGHPQGYQDCFTAFVADVHTAIRGELPAGLPTFADGHRAAVITEAVRRSAAERSWVEVVP